MMPEFVGNSSSAASREGTLAHEILERMLLNQELPESHGEFDIGSIIDDIAPIANEITTERELYDYNFLAEKRFSLEHIAEDMFGTGDILMWNDDRLIVGDLKYGRKVVGATKNKQLMLYCSGALRFIKTLNPGYNPRRFVVRIYQPRAANKDLEYEFSDRTLRRFEQTMREAANATEAKDAPRVPGDHCFFCPARGTPACPESMQGIIDLFDDTNAHVEEWDTARCEDVLAMKGDVINLFKRVEEVLLENADSLKDFEVTETYSYTPKASQLKAMLGQKAYREPQMITLTEAKKLIGKGNAEALFNREVKTKKLKRKKN